MRYILLLILILKSISLDSKESKNRFVDYLNAEFMKHIEKTIQEEQLESDPFSGEHKDSFICKTCLWTVKFIQYDANPEHYPWYDKAKQFIAKVCEGAGMFSYPVCKGAIDLYADSVSEGFLQRIISPEYVCTKTHLCKPHYKLYDHDAFASRILNETKIKNNLTSSEGTLSFIHLSDVHIDLLYKEGSVKNCPEVLCCREESREPSEGEIIRAGKYGMENSLCDSPKILLEEFAKHFFASDPDFLVYTGDNPPHDTWKTTLEDALKSTKAIVDVLDQYNTKGIPIYPSLGNHESRVVDELSFNKKSKYYKETLEFLRDYAELYRPYLEHDPQALESFRLNGFYSTRHRNTNLRIVSYNSFGCDEINFLLADNATDPGNQVTYT